MDILLKYFPDLSELQQSRYQKLLPLYRSWNEKINVVSRKDLENLYERHILHSLAIAKFISFAPGSKIMDIGTGGGFPGIPLAILFPKVEFHLTDSIEKKLKVVQDICQKIELSNVKILRQRAETVTETYDFFTNRAVANLSKIHRWIGEKVSKAQINRKKNGIISLKGGELTAEIKAYDNTVEVHEIKNYFDEPFFDTKKIVFAPLC